VKHLALRRCQMSWSNAGFSIAAACSMSSQRVAAGKGIPICASMRSSRVYGTPLPYLSCAIIAMAVASYLSGPAPSGSSAVNICPQALQRNRSISMQKKLDVQRRSPTRLFGRLLHRFCAISLPSIVNRICLVTFRTPQGQEYAHDNGGKLFEGVRNPPSIGSAINPGENLHR
jgi:hypothetical protein